MDLTLAIVIAVVVVALVFDYTNGFHDAANAIATSVSTRALTPRVALAAGRGDELRRRVPGPEGRQDRGRRDHHPGRHAGRRSRSALVIVMAGLLGAITWNLVTWWFGLPSSSSHALIGGLVGAALGRRRHRQVGHRHRQGAHPDGLLAAVRRSRRRSW